MTDRQTDTKDRWERKTLLGCTDGLKKGRNTGRALKTVAQSILHKKKGTRAIPSITSKLGQTPQAFLNAVNSRETLRLRLRLRPVRRQRRGRLGSQAD